MRADDVSGIIVLGDEQLEAKNYQKAIEFYDTALKLDPQNAEAWWSKGSALYFLSQYDEALVACDKAVSIDSTSVAAWDSKGWILYALNRYPEALSAFDKSLSLDATSADTWGGKGWTLYRLGKYGEALPAFDKSLSLDATVEINWRGKGWTLYQLKKYGDALTAFDKSLSLQSKNWDALEGKGTTLYQLKKYEEALTTFDKSLSIQPGNERIWTYKAYIFEAQNKNPEALWAYDKALSINPDYQSAKTNKADLLSKHPELSTAQNGSIPVVPPLVILFLLISAVGGLMYWRAKREQTLDAQTLLEQRVQYQLQLIADHPEAGSDFNTPLSALKARAEHGEYEAVEHYIHEQADAAHSAIMTGITNLRSDGAIFQISGESLRQLIEDKHYVDALIESKKVLLDLSGIRDIYSRAKNLKTSIPASPVLTLFDAGNYQGFINEGEEILELITQYRQLRTNANAFGRIPETFPETIDSMNRKELEEAIATLEDYIHESEITASLMVQAATILSKAEQYGSVPDNIPKDLHDMGQEQLKRMISALETFIQDSEEAAQLRIPARELLKTAQSFGPVPPSISTNLEKLNSQQLRNTISELEVFIQNSEETAHLREQVTSLLSKAKRFGRVPDTLLGDPASLNMQQLKGNQQALDTFMTSARPELVFTLEHSQLAVNNWHKTGIRITNKGAAHALDVNFTFSEEFQTKWIEPANVLAGEVADVVIGIQPKNEGTIPLEITASYHDADKNAYTSKNKFWVDVIDRMSTGRDMRSTPSSGQDSSSTPKPVTMRSLPPDMTDKYTESEFIGKGGFARVFKAKRKDGTYVAVKIPIDLDEATGKSFIAEMQNWTRFSHPNIVKIYDYNIMPLPYFEEELCDNALDKFKKPLEPAKAAWIMFNVCEGLKYAHARNVIHRDLKPQNILIKNGIPKISDWGLSKVLTESTSSTTTSFTPYYAAPEQITNRPKDHRTDIWQIGVILYELVTGILPFEGDAPAAILAGITTSDPATPGSINPDARILEPIILRCLEKDPAKRYQSVADLQKDLAAFLKMDYTESLRMSIGAKNLKLSAEYCSKLLLANLKSGDLHEAYKYATDLVNYCEGEVREQVKELSAEIRIRLDNDMDEVPDEIIEAADLIAHKIGVGLTTL